jgi:hypothetical protein
MPITGTCSLSHSFSSLRKWTINFVYAGLLFFVGTLVSGCGKKAGLTGRVVNRDNGQPVEGVPMKLNRFFGIGAGWTGYAKTKQMGTATSDANGEFAIDFRYKAGENYDFTLSIDQRDNFSLPDTTGDEEVYYLVKDPYENMAAVNGRHSGPYVFSVMPSGRLKVIPRDIPPLSDFSSVNILTGDTIDLNSYDVFDSGNGDPQYRRVPTNGTVKLYCRVVRDGYLYVYKMQVDLAPFAKKTVFLDL